MRTSEALGMMEGQRYQRSGLTFSLHNFLLCHPLKYSNITDNLFTTPLRKKTPAQTKAAITASHDFMHLSSVLLCTKASKVSRRQPFTAVVNTLALFIGQLSFSIRPECCFCACEAGLEERKMPLNSKYGAKYLIFHFVYLIMSILSI